MTLHELFWRNIRILSCSQDASADSRGVSMKERVEKIRVLRLIARLNVGGPAIHTILLTSSLAPERFDSTLVAGQIAPTEGDMSYLAQEQGVTPLIIPELGTKFSGRTI